MVRRSVSIQSFPIVLYFLHFPSFVFYRCCPLYWLFPSFPLLVFYLRHFLDFLYFLLISTFISVFSFNSILFLVVLISAVLSFKHIPVGQDFYIYPYRAYWIPMGKLAHYIRIFNIVYSWISNWEDQNCTINIAGNQRVPKWKILCSLQSFCVTTRSIEYPYKSASLDIRGVQGKQLCFIYGQVSKWYYIYYKKEHVIKLHTCKDFILNHMLSNFISF